MPSKVPVTNLRHFTLKSSVTSVHAEANAHSADWLMSVFVNELAPCAAVSNNFGSASLEFVFLKSTDAFGIETNKHFHGLFEPVVSTFCSPAPNFEGGWLLAREPALF